MTVWAGIRHRSNSSPNTQRVGSVLRPGFRRKPRTR